MIEILETAGGGQITIPGFLLSVVAVDRGKEQDSFNTISSQR